MFLIAIDLPRNQYTKQHLMCCYLKTFFIEIHHFHHDIIAINSLMQLKKKEKKMREQVDSIKTDIEFKGMTNMDILK